MSSRSRPRVDDRHPLPSKSATFLVTTVNSCTIAVAAMSASPLRTGIGHMQQGRLPCDGEIHRQDPLEEHVEQVVHSSGTLNPNWTAAGSKSMSSSMLSRVTMSSWSTSRSSRYALMDKSTYAGSPLSVITTGPSSAARLAALTSRLNSRAEIVDTAPPKVGTCLHCGPVQYSMAIAHLRTWLRRPQTSASTCQRRTPQASMQAGRHTDEYAMVCLAHNRKGVRVRCSCRIPRQRLRFDGGTDSTTSRSAICSGRTNQAAAGRLRLVAHLESSAIQCARRTGTRPMYTSRTGAPRFR